MRIGNWVRVIVVASLVGAGATTPAWAGGKGDTLQSGVWCVPGGDQHRFDPRLLHLACEALGFERRHIRD